MCSLLAAWQIDQADDASVRVPVDDCQLTEVFVERYEHPLLLVSEFNDGSVTRVRQVVADPADIVTGRRELACRTAPDAGVEQYLHAASTINGSTRSCSTSRWA